MMHGPGGNTSGKLTHTTVRPATTDDAQAIARVHIDSWRTTYRGIVPDSVLDSLDYREREQVWQREMSDSTRKQFVYVAEVTGGEVVGFISGGPERTGEYPEFSGEIYALYLDQAQQGLGTGQRLFETGVHALLEQGHRSMLIWALTDNPACGFYRYFGGVVIATQKIAIGQATLEETAFGWKNVSMVLRND
jgi:ribosomal protein S18 acetylase RimI-like enzyme